MVYDSFFSLCFTTDRSGVNGNTFTCWNCDYRSWYWAVMSLRRAYKDFTFVVSSFISWPRSNIYYYLLLEDYERGNLGVTLFED